MGNTQCFMYIEFFLTELRPLIFVQDLPEQQQQTGYMEQNKPYIDKEKVKRC